MLHSIYIDLCSKLVKLYIRYTSKRMQKFVLRFLIRNHALLLWFVREVPGYGIVALFANAPRFSRQKALQSGKRHRSPCIAVLYKTAHCGTDTTLQDGALRRGHQSAVLLVGEKRCVFKCRRGAFVAFFLMYTARKFVDCVRRWLKLMFVF